MANFDNGRFGEENVALTIIKWVLFAIVSVFTLGIPIILKLIKKNKK